MRSLAIRRIGASALVWAAFTVPAFGQSKLDARTDRTLSEIGNARVLVTMTAPKLGEASSAAYRDPAGFVARAAFDELVLPGTRRAGVHDRRNGRFSTLGGAC